jgi:digeranylgeranylglycerophospholipid reductase
VLVVGGSIAGNFLASLLAGHGIIVHVIEAHGTIGLPMKCAGIVSSKILDLMHVPPGLILNRISSARIRSARNAGESIVIRIKDQPVVLDRIGFDRHFMQVAVKRGAVYHAGERVTRIEHHDDKVIVFSTGGMYEAKVLAGCDGAHSIVARDAGIVHDFITGKQAIITFHDATRHEGGGQANPVHPGIADPSSCELHFDPSWNDLFAWVIPAGSGAGMVARVGLASRQHVSTLFESFFQQQFGCPVSEATPRGIVEKIQFTGGTIPVGLPVPCAFDRTILVGDAACQVKASTGGGIVMLAIAARIAARAILTSFDSMNFSRAFFVKHYQVPFFKRVRGNLKMHLAVHAAIKHFTGKDFKTLFFLASQPNIHRALLTIADMDFPARFIIQILGEPRFYGWLAGFVLRDYRIFRDVFGILLLGKAPRAMNRKAESINKARRD